MLLKYTEIALTRAHQYITGWLSVNKPSRILLRSLFKDKDFDRQEVINTYFLPSLKFIAQEILNPSVPFQADADDEKYCKRCAFSSLCKI